MHNTPTAFQGFLMFMGVLACILVVRYALNGYL
jgi:hypothetical protein